MSKQKHTPGPWEVRADPSHYDSFTTVVAGSGEQRKGMLRELIVEIGGWAGIETAEANARLIAAAPDMLEALKNARQFISNGIQLGYIDEPAPGSPEAQTLGIIVDAIRKAEVNVEVTK